MSAIDKNEEDLKATLTFNFNEETGTEHCHETRLIEEKDRNQAIDYIFKIMENREIEIIEGDKFNLLIYRMITEKHIIKI